MTYRQAAVSSSARGPTARVERGLCEPAAAKPKPESASSSAQPGQRQGPSGPVDADHQQASSSESSDENEQQQTSPPTLLLARISSRARLITEEDHPLPVKMEDTAPQAQVKVVTLQLLIRKPAGRMLTRCLGLHELAEKVKAWDGTPTTAYTDTELEI